MTRSLRVAVPVSLCAAAIALTACSSSGGAPKSTSGSTGGASLSKADFITKMDATCAGVLTQLKAIPGPTGPGDFAAILKIDAFTEAAEPAFQKAAATLVDASPDAAALHKNWLDLDIADFQAQLPLLTKFDAAAKASDAAALNTLASQADNVSDHSKQEATYLTGYGLTDCSALENFGNS